jgi:hypothetical protein
MLSKQEVGEAAGDWPSYKRSTSNDQGSQKPKKRRSVTYEVSSWERSELVIQLTSRRSTDCMLLSTTGRGHRKDKDACKPRAQTSARQDTSDVPGVVKDCQPKLS